MEIRRVLPEEYGQLVLAPEWKDAIDPENSTAIGAFENGKLVGQTILVGMAHVEGTHIAPEFRNGTLFARFDKALTELGRERGLDSLVAYIADKDMLEYCKRLGWKELPVKVIMKEL